jgi:hypothetical protein
LEEKGENRSIFNQVCLAKNAAQFLLLLREINLEIESDDVSLRKFT